MGRPINRLQHRPKGRTSSCTEPRRVSSLESANGSVAKGKLMRCSFCGHHGGLDKHMPSHGEGWTVFDTPHSRAPCSDLSRSWQSTCTGDREFLRIATLSRFL